MDVFWFSFFGLVFGLSFLGTFLSIFLAFRLQVLDKVSSAPSRKFQKIPVPLLGATGFVLVATFLMSFVWLFYKYNLVVLPSLIYSFRLFWIILAILWLLLVGFLDDLGRISRKFYILNVLSAIIVAVFCGGLKIEALSYPFDFIDFRIFWNLNLGIAVFQLNLSQILAFFWLLFCTAATKFVDGSDGLCATIGFISFLTIAATANQINQPIIVIFALIWATGVLGFLPFNFPDAKTYLGDGGSLIIGFVIGVLSILGGAKVATAGTVLGWFVLDIMLVMLTRISHNQSILDGDSKLHWHHRLHRIGFSKLQILVFTTIILLFSAQIGLFLSTFVKFLVILFQVILLIFFICRRS